MSRIQHQHIHVHSSAVELTREMFRRERVGNRSLTIAKNTLVDTNLLKFMQSYVDEETNVRHY
jgi:hypothetical protein